MSTDGKALLQSVSRSDIDEIEGLFAIDSTRRVQPAVLEAPASGAVQPKSTPVPPPAPLQSAPSSYAPAAAGDGQSTSAAFGGGPMYDTLTEPVWMTLRRDVMRVVNNLRNVVFPNPYRDDPGKALRDWDLWGPFFFIIALALTLSWGTSAGEKSKVFAVVFAILSAGAVILTLNVLLLGGQIIFFQSLSLIGYCVFPLDIAALVCLLHGGQIVNAIVVLIALGWSSWSAYPFVSTAVPLQRRALAIYPVFLLYISVAFLIMATN